MNWFEQNRFLGTFVVVFGIATLAALYFLWSARSSFAQARARFDENATELNRLQRLTPFPNDANLKKMKAQAGDYAGQLEKLKEQLKARVLPATPLAPNEFQSRLRQAVTAIGEKARVNRVKLPDNFFLGFNEFASALPDNAAAPVLGQQLAQVELLLNIMIDARVDAVSSLRRVPATATAIPVTAATPATGASGVAAARNAPAAASGLQLLERAVIEVAFISNPGAARRVLNQVAAAEQQFFITRTLHVLNEKDKGPERNAGAAPGGNLASAVAPAASPSNSALNFIVGTERLTTSARIEMVRFAF